MQLFSISDIHVDEAQNMRWVEKLSNHPDDALIVAGDVSHDPKLVRRALQCFKSKFRHVFYTPGNHDLWVFGNESSMERMHALLRICEEEQVHTRATVVGQDVDGIGGVLVVPILSWHHQSFDTEPDIIHWQGIPQVQDAMVDYHRCVWPEAMDPSTEEVAVAFDEMNQSVEQVLEQSQGLPIISFSHFVPLIELTPEKRFLFLPTLNKAVGSRFLGERVRALGSVMHVFGHTHFGWDHRIEGTRYVQAALGYPYEWAQREASMKIGELPESPMLLWDSVTGMAPDSVGRWSQYYQKQARTPEVCNALAPYVAKMYTKLPGGVICDWPMGPPPGIQNI